MRIGLTGARGVLGTRLFSALSLKGHEILPFDGDIRDSSSLDPWVTGLDAVVHAAAIVPVRKVMDHLSVAISVNVGGTANVARAVARNPNCHLTYISTSHVYASSDRPLKEDEVPNPISYYGRTKLQGEQWVSSLLERTLIVRVFSFFDERQTEPYLIPSLQTRIVSATRGSSLQLVGALNMRDIADARWIAEVCARLVDATQTGTVNCATGICHSVLELALKLTEVLDRTDVKWDFDKNDPPNVLAADVSLLVSRIGVLPSFDLQSALRRYVSSQAQE